MCLDFLDCFAESFERNKHVKLHVQTGNAVLLWYRSVWCLGWRECYGFYAQLKRYSKSIMLYTKVS